MLILFGRSNPFAVFYGYGNSLHFICIFVWVELILSAKIFPEQKEAPISVVKCSNCRRRQKLRRTVASTEKINQLQNALGHKNEQIFKGIIHSSFIHCGWICLFWIFSRFLKRWRSFRDWLVGILVFFFSKAEWCLWSWSVGIWCEKEKIAVDSATHMEMGGW